LKTIKKFFQLLTKQGLYKGQLFLEGTEFRFSTDKGFEQIEGQEVKIPTLKIQAEKKETIKREPVAADEFEIELDKKEKEELKVEKIPTLRDSISTEDHKIDLYKKPKKKVAKESEPISILSEKPPSEQKKKQLFTIISFVIFFIVAVFIVFFGIKFFSKKSSLSIDNPEQTETAVTDQEQKTSETGENLTAKITEQQQYMNQTRDYMVAEDLENARESMEKAKYIDNNNEVKKLENELKTMEKLKAEAEREKIKKVEKPKTIRTVSIRDLSTRVVRKYTRQLQNIRINLPKKIKASGYINMKLQINEKGNISISSYNDAGLNVKPSSKKKYVVELIKSGIWIIQFSPPADKKNQLVKVGNWRLNFQVSQYKQRMILRKE